jgi:Protein of unknown function (DUF4058)
MPSPFPGMDPYLEDPRSWRDVHHSLISSGRDLLNDQLRPKYLVRIEERVYVDVPGSEAQSRDIYPDLHVESLPAWGDRPLAAEGSALAVAEPIVVDTAEVEITEARIHILDRNDESVVTVIEVLSPANKIRGSNGGESFEQKRREVLHSPSHWVEIDLLRAGHSWTPLPRRFPPHEYLAHVSRADRRPKGLAWPIRLSQRLPVISIPLRKDDPDAKLDLQAMIEVAYLGGSYDLQVDYNQPPVPPLKGAWAEWADRLLREKGLRRGESAPPT